MIIDPGTVAEIFTKMNLFAAKNYDFLKNRSQSQGQIFKLKNLNKKSKLHALERHFFRGVEQPLNYVMHDPELNGKGLRYFKLENK
jgi:hypothetical protein